MEIKGLIKSLFIVGLFMGAVLLGSYQFFLPQRKPTLVDNNRPDPSLGWKIPISQFQPSGQVTDSSAYSTLRDQGGVARGLPVRLKIPSIGVDTAIEDAYITSDGRMDVPAGSINVAWYALGPTPGQKGSSVIGGHFGIDNDVPKVFYNLNKLNTGDKIYVVNDKDETLAFVVRSIRLFDRNANADSVFFSSDGLSRLNLITCEGVWNKTNDSYPDRRVVFAESIPNEGNIVVNPQMSGIIEPISNPVIANPTTNPLATPTTASTSTIAAIPSTITQVQVPQIPIYLKALYSSPADGAFSSFLIFAILFMAFRIIRR